MSTIMSDADYNHTEEAGRMQIWSRGIGYMLDNPVFGVGAQNFQSAEGMLSPFAHRQQLGLGVRWNAAHNSFVQVGAELGLPGLILFLCIITSAFRFLARARRVGGGTQGAHHTQLSQALTAALIGFVVGAFFLSLAYSEMFYALIALAVGFAKVTVGSAQEQPR
jgi:O-antigen ligase